jgi:hypothetical protein
MSRHTLEIILGLLLVSAVVTFLIFLGVALWLGLTWVICLVVGGFGWEIPFWPTFGAIFLVTLLVNWLRPSRRS